MRERDEPIPCSHPRVIPTNRIRRLDLGNSLQHFVWITTDHRSVVQDAKRLEMICLVCIEARYSVIAWMLMHVPNDTDEKQDNDQNKHSTHGYALSMIRSAAARWCLMHEQILAFIENLLGNLIGK